VLGRETAIQAVGNRLITLRRPACGGRSRSHAALAILRRGHCHRLVFAHAALKRLPVPQKLHGKGEFAAALLLCCCSAVLLLLLLLLPSSVCLHLRNCNAPRTLAVAGMRAAASSEAFLADQSTTIDPCSFGVGGFRPDRLYKYHSQEHLTGVGYIQCLYNRLHTLKIQISPS
jgi:hypothetical protein